MHIGCRPTLLLLSRFTSAVVMRAGFHFVCARRIYGKNVPEVILPVNLTTLVVLAKKYASHDVLSISDAVALNS